MLPKACAALFPILYLVVAGEEPSLSEHKQKTPLLFRAELLNDENGNPIGRTRNVFKILQLTDIHYGEGPGTTWGQQQDARSIELIQSLLRAEEPDLVVLSGDNLTADYIKEDASAIQNQIVQAMVEAQPDVRWCLVMGNHDDHPFETFLDDENVVLTDATTTRGELLTSDAALDGSVTVAGSKSMYKLPLFYAADNGTEHDSASAEIYIFDTGGGSTREAIDQEQVEWFVEQTLSSSIAKPIPAIAFQHIATNEKAWAFGSECSGTDAEPNKVKTVKNDRGLFEAMLNYEHIFFVGIGHNHGKSYCCNYKKLHLCYGRHSGFGGYGKVDRGGRLYELRLEEGENKQTFSWDSWVRLDDGSIVDQYQPDTVKEYPSLKRRKTVAPTRSPTIGVVDTSATFAPSTSRASEGSSTSAPTHEPSQPLTANAPNVQNSPTSLNDGSLISIDLDAAAAADEPSSAANQSRSRWVMSTCAVIPSLLLM